MVQPSKNACLLVNLAPAHNNVGEQYDNSDSEEKSQILHFKIHNHIMVIMMI
jgi:hypothetical protein